MAHQAALLSVLGDPTRLALVDALRDGPLNVSQLAEHVPVSRSAVSQHLKVLTSVDLVDHEVHGNQRHYRLRPERLGDLRAYVDRLWSDALESFADTESAAESAAESPAESAAESPAEQAP